MNIVSYSEKELKELMKKDKKIKSLIEKYGVIERESIPDIFQCIVNSIIGQQISSKAAASIWNRFKEYFGEISYEKICNATIEEIQKLGITTKKSIYIKEIAEKIKDGSLDLEKLKEKNDEEVIKELIKLNGIGVWSAEMIMIFSMGRKDVISYGDLVIVNALKKLYGHEKIDKKLFEEYKKKFSPYNTIVSLYLWTFSKMEDENMENYFIYDTVIGDLRIESNGKEVTRIEFQNENSGKESSELDDKNKKIMKKNYATDLAYKELTEYFKGKRKEFTFPIAPKGTEFQKKVWNALINIPYGETKTYKEIAVDIGNEKACRAVGLANNRNPLPIVVPCHRVIGSNGKLVGYAGGLNIKEKLLEIEKK